MGDLLAVSIVLESVSTSLPVKCRPYVFRNDPSLSWFVGVVVGLLRLIVDVLVVVAVVVVVGQKRIVGSLRSTLLLLLIPEVSWLIGCCSESSSTSISIGSMGVPILTCLFK